MLCRSADGSGWHHALKALEQHLVADALEVVPRVELCLAHLRASILDGQRGLLLGELHFGLLLVLERHAFDEVVVLQLGDLILAESLRGFEADAAVLEFGAAFEVGALDLWVHTELASRKGGKVVQSESDTFNEVTDHGFVVYGFVSVFWRSNNTAPHNSI